MKAAARLLLILALVAPAFASAQVQPQAPAPTCKLFASATTVKANTKVRLDWTTTNASSGYLTEVGAIPAKGTAYVVPGKNTTYAASFTGPGGSVVCRVAIAVSVGAGPGSAPVDTNSPVDTSGSSINTNVPVDLSGKANLGGTIPLPTAQSVAPDLTAPSGGTGFMGGIVPLECRGRSTIANCDLCSLAQLGQNLANFLLGLTVPAAALLFAWAGILYFSSRGNPVLIGRAHTIFKTVVIGFVIAVSAWVLVNTVMNMLIQGKDLRGWNWRELKCAQTREARLYNMTLSQYLTSSLPSVTSYSAPSTGSAFGTTCAQGGTLAVTENGNICVSSKGVYPAGYSGGTAGTPISSLTGGGVGPGGCAAGDELTAENFCLSSSGTPYYPGTGYRGTSCPSGYVYATEEGGYCQNPNRDTDWVEACPTGYAYTAAEGGYCENPTNPNDWKELAGSGGGVIKNPQMAAEIEAACLQVSSVNCNTARGIALQESGGGRDCTTSHTGAAGCMQVLARTACGIDSSISASCGACLRSGNSTSAACAPVISTIRSDTQMGTTLGVTYIAQMQNMPALRSLREQYGTCQITAAAYFQGPGKVLEVGGIPSNAVTYVNKACNS